MTRSRDERAPEKQPGRCGRDLKQDVDQLVASDEASRSLRKAARLGAAGFPPVIDEATRTRLSPVAVRACAKIAEAWGLEPQELASLLAMTPSDYANAKECSDGVLLDPEQFFRAGLLIEIFIVLVTLIVGPLAFEWPRRPNNNPLFRGASAIELMLTGGVESMKKVLGHLQAMAMGL